MGWLSAIKALLQLAGLLAKWAGDRQLISAGEAKAVVEGNRAVFEKLDLARKARDSLADPAVADRVRDKFTRK